MAEPVLVDNDVLLKLCRYGWHQVLATDIGEPPAAMLAIGRFTLRSRVARSRHLTRLADVAAALEEAIASLRLIEPTEEEVRLAAEFEEHANRLSVDFDTGESQLLAIMLRRGFPLLLTGDKRAVVAIHRMSIGDAEGRIACFEQALATIIKIHGLEPLRAAICREPEADKAATTAFSCSAFAVSEEVVLAGLISYVGHLRGQSGKILTHSDDLS